MNEYSANSSGPLHITVDELLEIVSQRSQTDRLVIGLVGCPGSGKSTLAEKLNSELGARAQILPMDGFHLAQSVLEALGLSNKKGTPQTFDASGFISLLRRVSHQSGNEIIYSPKFDRTLEEPIACALPISPSTEIVIVEGNYLLLDDPAWAEARKFIHMSVFLEVDEPLRLERLHARHVEFGKSPEFASSWMQAVDIPNASLIQASQQNADYVVTLS